MLSLQNHLDKLSVIIEKPIHSGEDIHISVSSTFETVRQGRLEAASIVLKIKELKLLKKEIQQSIREISAAFVSEREAIGKKPEHIFARMIFGSRAIGAANTATRSTITMQKNKALEQYRWLVKNIDTIVLTLEKLKNWVEQRIYELSQTPPTNQKLR